MRINTLHLLLIFILGTSCSVLKPKPKIVDVYVEDGFEITELEGRFKIKPNRVIAHTVFDEDIAAEKPKEVVATPPEIQEPSPVYHYYVVLKDETLSEISLKILGTSKKWKMIREWNSDHVSKPKRLQIGTRLKYVPNDVNQGPERLPASSSTKLSSP